MADHGSDRLFLAGMRPLRHRGHRKVERAEAAFWRSAVWLPAEAARAADRRAGICPTDATLQDGDGVYRWHGLGNRGERMRRNAHEAGLHPTFPPYAR